MALAHVFCFVLYYWPARKGNVQSRITFHLCRRKTKWWTELPEGFAYPTPPPPASTGPISAGRGRVISGRLANRFGSRFKVTRPSFFGGGTILLWGRGFIKGRAPDKLTGCEHDFARLLYISNNFFLTQGTIKNGLKLQSYPFLDESYRV